MESEYSIGSGRSPFLSREWKVFRLQTASCVVANSSTSGVASQLRRSFGELRRNRRPSPAPVIIIRRRRPSSSAGAGHHHGRRRRPSPAPVIIIRRHTCFAFGIRIQYRFWSFSTLKPRMERVSFRKGSEVSQGVSQHPPAPAPPPAPERLTSRPGPIPDVDHPRPLHIWNLPPGPLAAHGQGS